MFKPIPSRIAGCRILVSLLWLVLILPVPGTLLMAEEAEMEFGRVPYLLFRLKFDPEGITDAEISQLARQQAANDQSLHRQIATHSETLEGLKEAGMSGRQTEYLEMQIKDLRAGIVFSREEVEGVDLQQALPELTQKFRQHLSKIAGELPDTFAADFPHPANSYEYDSQSGGLAFPANSFPCQWMNDPSCPPNTNGTHFFLVSTNVMRQHNSAVIPGLEDHFPFRCNPVRFGAGFDTNPYGFPKILGTANRAIVALDHNIAMLYLPMSADMAGELLEEGTMQREHRGVSRTVQDPDKPFVSVIQ